MSNNHHFIGLYHLFYKNFNWLAIMFFTGFIRTLQKILKYKVKNSKYNKEIPMLYSMMHLVTIQYSLSLLCLSLTYTHSH